MKYGEFESNRAGSAKIIVKNLKAMLKDKSLFEELLKSLILIVTKYPKNLKISELRNHFKELL